MKFPYLAILLLCVLLGCSGTQAGNTARDFTVIPISDKTKRIELSSFKGKIVLLDFWATWCGPCIQAMPEVQAVYDKYKDKGLVVMSISPESEGTIEEFHKTAQFNYPVYRDADGTATEAYAPDSIPCFVLVKDGKILWREEGYGEGMLLKAVSDVLR